MNVADIREGDRLVWLKDAPPCRRVDGPIDPVAVQVRRVLPGGYKRRGRVLVVSDGRETWVTPGRLARLQAVSMLVDQHGRPYAREGGEL